MDIVNHHLRLLRDGKQQGLQYFMQQHLRALTYFAGRFVKQEEVAEEIVQDSFVKVWEARANFEAPDKVKAFLYIATRNACLNRLASDRRQYYTTYEELDEEIQQPGRDVLTGMIHAETIALVHQELKRLPAQQAAVFRLSYFEGLTTEEICQQLAITPNALFLARSRATQTLKGIFKRKDLLYYIAFLQMIWTKM